MFLTQFVQFIGYSLFRIDKSRVFVESRNRSWSKDTFQYRKQITSFWWFFFKTGSDVLGNFCFFSFIMESVEYYVRNIIQIIFLIIFSQKSVTISQYIYPFLEVVLKIFILCFKLCFPSFWQHHRYGINQIQKRLHTRIYRVAERPLS